MKCGKLYDKNINGAPVNYDGYYDHGKLGFFGKWYFGAESTNGDVFFMKFTLEDWLYNHIN